MSFNNIITKQINSIPICSYRISIDPSSNPDPNVGGLIVTASETHPTPFNIPITVGPIELGIGAPYANDPENAITVFPNKIRINKSGHYQMSASIYLLSNLVTPNNIAQCQILETGQAIFANAPFVAAGGPFISLVGTPAEALFNLGSFNSSISNGYLAAGTELSMVFYIRDDSCVISLTSNWSIELLR